MSSEHNMSLGEASSLANYISAAIEEGELDVSETLSIDAVKEVIAGDEMHADYKQSFVDAWKQEMYVEAKDGSFIVGSLGADGQKGTSDDIIVDAKGGIVQGEFLEEGSIWGYVQLSFVVFFIIAAVLWIKQKRG